MIANAINDDKTIAGGDKGALLAVIGDIGLPCSRR